MTHTPHDLHDDFPEFADRFAALRAENARFAHLADKYHEVNRAIHRAEARIEPVSEETEAALRRNRMHLKDEIAALLRA